MRAKDAAHEARAAEDRAHIAAVRAKAAEQEFRAKKRKLEVKLKEFLYLWNNNWIHIFNSKGAGIVRIPRIALVKYILALIRCIAFFMKNERDDASS